MRRLLPLLLALALLPSLGAAAQRPGPARGDPAVLAHAAHTLKGVVATFSAVGADAARKLEQMGRSRTLAGASDVADHLGTVLDQLDAQLAGLTVDRLR